MKTRHSSAARIAVWRFQPPLHQQRCYRPPSPNIRACVEGIAQNIADETLGGNLPDQSRSLDGIGRQLHIMITEPLECLTHTPQFSKLSEDELNRFADSLVGMKHNLPERVTSISNR